MEEEEEELKSPPQELNFDAYGRIVEKLYDEAKVIDVWPTDW